MTAHPRRSSGIGGISHFATSIPSVQTPSIHPDRSSNREDLVRFPGSSPDSLLTPMV
jgi:hypothetical protein